MLLSKDLNPYLRTKLHLVAIMQAEPNLLPALIVIPARVFVIVEYTNYLFAYLRMYFPSGVTSENFININSLGILTFSTTMYPVSLSRSPTLLPKSPSIMPGRAVKIKNISIIISINYKY